MQQQCNKCRGEGKTVTSTCHVCRGGKLTDSLDSLSIYIEKGAPDNHKVTFRAAADEYVNVRAGSITVTIQEVPHPVFERKGNDLKISMDITLQEALLGFVRTVKHLDGHEVLVDRSNRVTKPGLTLRQKGEGMPVYQQYGDFGDLLITVVVRLPTELTPV